ncbi:MAG: hypothetical protein LBQ20_11285 [Rhodanobacter sp.]|jgi:hypothetical protein|nr:hypothetical protein [Rhodanobacter sp.]
MSSTQSFEPLKPLDANGLSLFVGSNVRVLSVESCCTELPREDQERLRQIVGQTRRIIEFDKWGFIWLSFEAEPTSGGDFCLLPKEVMFV